MKYDRIGCDSMGWDSMGWDGLDINLVLCLVQH